MNLTQQGDDFWGRFLRTDEQRKMFRPLEKLPLSAIEGLGLKAGGKSDYSLIRFYRHKVGWSNQTLFNCPLVGLASSSSGPMIEVGSVGRFVDAEVAEKFFPHSRLERLLESMEYSGLVHVERASLEAEGDHVGGVSIGELSTGLYSLLQAGGGGLEEWIHDPQGVWLKESWTVNLLLSQFPFPLEGQVKKPRNLGEPLRKHLWMAKDDGLAFAVVTNWGKTIKSAVETSLWTIRNVRLENAQFRSDILGHVLPIWKRVTSSQC